MPVFARNPKEHAVFSSLHILAVAGGSIGGTLIDILARTGVGLTHADCPETLLRERRSARLTGDRWGSESEDWPSRCPYQS